MRWGLLGGLLAGLLAAGCNPELHQRCDDGQACPNAFYCDGVWCFPDGIGPGEPDATRDPDGTVELDATPDGATPDAMDRDAGEPLDGAVEMGDGGGRPLEIDRYEPDDLVLTRFGAPERGALRILLVNAERVHYAVTDDAAPEACPEGVATELDDGALVVPPEAWADRAPDGRFHVCVRRGAMGRAQVVGPVIIDEVPPRIARLDRLDESAGQRFALTATEDVEEGWVHVGFGCERRELGVSVDGDAFVEIERVDMLPAGISLRLVDAFGNDSGCMDVRLLSVDCHDGAAYRSGADGIERGDVAVLQPRCDRIAPDGGELVGTCDRCAMLLESNVDGDYTYDHVEFYPRRATFAVPRPFGVLPGQFTDHVIADAVRLDADRIVVADEDTIALWTRPNGEWRVRRSVTGLSGPIVAVADATDTNTKHLIVANYRAPGDVRLLDENMQASGGQLEGAALTELIPFRPSGRGGEQLLGLGVDGSLYQFTWNGAQFEREELERGVRFVAPLTIGAAQGAVFVLDTGPTLSLYVRFEGASRDLAIVSPPGCLTVGDWTGDGTPDVILCDDDVLNVYALPADLVDEPDAVLLDQFELEVERGRMTQAIVGQADFDARADLLVVNEDGQLVLITNNTEVDVPPRVLDVPFLHPRLRGLAPSSDAMDVALLHPQAAHMLRLSTRDERTPPGRVVDLELNDGEQVVGVGDVDGDRRDDVLVVDTGTGRLRLLGGDRVRPLTAVIPLAPAEGDDDVNSTAVVLAELSGDGIADIAGFNGERLLYWFGQLGAPPPALRHGLIIAGPNRLLRAADWLGDGRDELILSVDGAVRHLALQVLPIGPTFQAVDLGRIPGLTDFRIGEVNTELPGLEFHGLFTDAGDPFETTFGVGELDMWNGGARSIAGVRLFEGLFAGRKHVLRLIPAGPSSDVVWRDDDGIANGPFTDVALGDVDGDGQTDLFGLISAPGETEVQVFRRRLDGDFAEPVSVPIADTDEVHIGDFDGDGWLDLLRVERL